MNSTSATPPSHSISLNKQIYCFEVSHFEWSSNLFCAALQNKIVLGLIHFPEESDTDEFSWEQLKEINHDIRCHAIAFAPDTSLVILPKSVKFCTADADFKIRIYRSNLQDSDTVQCLTGHTSYINDIAWEPSNGKYLASVSDDHSCQIRAQHDDFESQIIFRFKSPGMVVRWHPDDLDKLLVAEKRGTIHIYNINSKQITLSIETSKAPLMSADWCQKNHLYVTALAAGEIIFFDLRCPYRAMETKAIHEDGGFVVKYSPNNQDVVASIGRPNVTLKVTNMKTDLSQLVASVKLFGGLCWHSRLSYVCAADDEKLCFWKVQLK